MSVDLLIIVCVGFCVSVEHRESWAVVRRRSGGRLLLGRLSLGDAAVRREEPPLRGVSRGNEAPLCCAVISTVYGNIAAVR